MRILITGSRNWNDRQAIRDAIAEHAEPAWDVTVIHGCAPGADEHANWVALELGLGIEAHPAQWSQHGKKAGPIRNQQMVDAGADICLAFPLGTSVGAWDCVRRAKAAGIPVKVHSL